MDKNKYIFSKYKLNSGTVNPVILPIDRKMLASLIGKLFSTQKKIVGAEIGVERGKYSEVLFKAIPNLKLWMVDPLVPYGDYRQHVSKMQMDQFYNEIIHKFKNEDCVIARDFSMNIVKDMADNSLDFVYIDGNHDFINTANDLVEWLKKVKNGGIIAGHDYTHFVKEFNRCDVKYVIDAYTKSFNIPTWYITNEKTSPSWFWVKE